MNRCLAMALAGLVLLCPPAAAQYPAVVDTRDADDRFDSPFNPEGTYDASIPDPATGIGHPIGARFTPHYKAVAYFEALARLSPRAHWETYGESYEGRPLGTLIVTSDGNAGRLETLRRDLLRLTDPRTTSRRDAVELARRLPAVVWLSYSVHGDEASSMEAALAVAYELVAGTGSDVTGLLDSLIVVIDPCLNPDGRDRYADWINRAVGREPNANADAWEHHQPWPGGRYNHYLFDLNRDWAWLTQRESQARTVAYLKWRPQVHVDFHEMGHSSSYFFFPAAEPVNTNLPEQTRYWGGVFGRGNAAAFDRRGWRYYTSEEFDLLYPGYGDTWPSFQGATGMTYEQAGHGRAGVEVRRRDGTLLTLRERARRHYVASMATLATARREREPRLIDFYEFFNDGANGGSPGPAAYLFPPGDDPARVAELVDLLRAHGAEVEVAREVIRVSRARDHEGAVHNRSFPAGTFVVPMNQPLRALLSTLLEPEAALPESLFYDVTAWSLPLAFGVNAYRADRKPPGRLEAVDEAPRPAGGVTGSERPVAWLLPWNTNAAPRCLNRLLKAGVRTSFATRAFELDGRTFDRGTIVVPREANSDTLATLLERVARETGVALHGAGTGWTPSGADLGSSRMVPITPPRVAVVGGDGVDPTSFGAVWFLLDRQYEIPHTIVPLDRVAATDLSAFNVLVFPGDWSNGRSYGSALDSLATDRIRRWIEGGGTFVGLKGGATWATANRSGLTSTRLKPAESDDDEDDEEPEKPETERRLETVEQTERERRLDRIPGTVFRVRLDPGHPLAFGYKGEARVLKTSSTVFEPSDTGRNVGYFPEASHVSGYISKENAERLANTPFLIVEPIGRGRAVLYNDDPNFRVFWHGLNRLFLNSLFFAGGY